jgi:hypothetical protein
VYLSIPIILIRRITPKRKGIVHRTEVSLAIVLVTSLAGIAIAEPTTFASLMVLATVTTTLSTLFLSALVVSGKALRAIERAKRSHALSFS